MSERNWIKREHYNRSKERPDVWEYKSNANGFYPAIALLKKDDKVIATFWGPKKLKNIKIVKHVKVTYQMEGKLKICRIDSCDLKSNPESGSSISINSASCANARAINMRCC